MTKSTSRSKPAPATALDEPRSPKPVAIRPAEHVILLKDGELGRRGQVVPLDRDAAQRARSGGLARPATPTERAIAGI